MAASRATAACLSPDHLGYARLHEVGSARPDDAGSSTGAARLDDALRTGADSMDVLMRRSEDDRPDARAGVAVRSFRATPASGRAIRAFVREVLRTADLPGHVASDAELVVSELTANAIEHGAGDELTVVVDVTRRPWLSVSVTCVSDAAPALRAWRTWAIATPDARSGRGLGIVRRLMDDVDVEARNGRMTVRCRRRVMPGE